MVRGALFAGKLLGTILSAIMLLVWLCMAGLFLRAWFIHGDEVWTIHPVASMLQLVFGGAGAVLVATAWGAAVGVIIMGIGAAVEYRRRPIESDVSSLDVPPTDTETQRH